MDNKQDVRYSLSPEGEEQKNYGDFHIFAKDFGCRSPYEEFLKEHERTHPQKAEPPRAKTDNELKQEEIGRLRRLLYDRDTEFQKAKGKRTVTTIIVLSIFYFLLFVVFNIIYNEETIFYNIMDVGEGNIIAIAILSIVAAVFHFWANLTIFGQLFQKGSEETEILESIKNRIIALEKEIL